MSDESILHFLSQVDLLEQAMAMAALTAMVVPLSVLSWPLRRHAPCLAELLTATQA